MKSSTYIATHSITLIEKLANSIKINDGVTATVLAGAICEAFLNDMQRFFQHAADSKYETTKKSEEKDSVFKISKFEFEINPFNLTTDLETKIAKTLLELDRSCTAKKYAAIIELLKETNESGDSRIQNLRNLFIIRNNIVHSKGLTLSINYDGNDQKIPPTASDYPDFLRPLFKQKIIILPKHNISWLYLLDTMQYCRWLKNTIHNSMFYILENLDEKSPVSHYFKEGFYVYQ